MYEYLRGRLVRKSPTAIVVEVGGIGFGLRIPLSTYEALPADGEVYLLCHHILRDDAALLYGFASESERTLFRLLLSVSRIGPGVAIGILSAASVGRIVGAIRSDDARALEAIKGVGKKTALRLIIELKESVEQMAPELLPADEPAGGYSRVDRDAALALTALGYTPSAAARAVEQAQKAGTAATLEELIKRALQ